jgi:hypothetical protein
MFCRNVDRVRERAGLPVEVMTSQEAILKTGPRAFQVLKFWLAID